MDKDEGQTVCYGDSPASLSDLEFDNVSTFRPCKHLKLGKKHSVIKYSTIFKILHELLLNRSFPQLYARSVMTVIEQEKRTTGSL